MGKIIQIQLPPKPSENPSGRGEIILEPRYKIGHIIGFEDGKILCEELDLDYNFVYHTYNCYKRIVFACDPSKAKQIGYLDPAQELVKR